MQFSQFAAPGTPQPTVQPHVRELLGLPAAERQSMEETLNRHFAEVERNREAGIYETNRNNDAGVPEKVFVVPSLPGDEVKQRADELLAELRGILGEERWPLLQATLDEATLVQHRWSGGVGPESILSQGQQELSISLTTDDKGTPTWFCTFSLGGLVGAGGGTLSMFLPEGDPNRTEGADKFAGWVSNALRQRGMAWLQEQAIARLGKKDKP